MYEIDHDDYEDSSEQARKWWKAQRSTYNLCIVTTGFCALVCYYILGGIFVKIFEDEPDLTLFEIVPQSAVYLLFANLFYSLGYEMDIRYNTHNSLKWRRRLFNAGVLFSGALPFINSAIPIVKYLYKK